MRDFRDYAIWIQGIQLAVKTYELSKLLPDEERYGLRSQITRAVVSIPSNIAEGCSRGDKEFKRFLEMALGSAFELETQLILIELIGLIESELIHGIMPQLHQEQKQINSLISKIKGR